MDDLIWAGIWSMTLSNALKNMFVIGVVLGWIGYGFMTAKWKKARWKGVYDKIKQESDLAPLLDTPQKETQEKMEGNLICYPEPEDEGPLTKVCPTCFERYPENRQHCIYKSCNWDTLVHRPITEPLPTLQLATTDETAMKLNTLIQNINEVERQFESELEMIRTALEEKAYEYNKKRPYSFSDEETLSLYNLYNRVHSQSHEGERAS